MSRCALSRAVLIVISALAPAASTLASSSAAVTTPSAHVQQAAGVELTPGQSLEEALLVLRRAGLRVVSTSGAVLPSMRIGAVETDQELERILQQILAPHGLIAEPGAGGTWIVRPNAEGASGALVGEVRSRHSSRPLASAGVELVAGLGSGEADAGRALRALTNAGGRFRFEALPAGDYELRISARGFADQRLEVRVDTGSATRVQIALQPQPYVAEEIAVRPGERSLLQEDPAAPMALGREEIEALPHLAGDLFRALDLLPGVTSGDLSARPRIHGGREDEVQVLLDGQELYETYHLQDFDGGISMVPASLLESAHLRTGAFGAERGDRMSGVLDLRTRQPTTLESRLSLSLLTAEASSGGGFRRGADRFDGAWFGSARLGSIELANRLFGREDPGFWDAFGKLDLGIGGAQQLRARVLQAGDRLDFRETVGEESKGIDTRYDTGYAWATHQAVVGASLLVETTLSSSDIERDRRGFEDEDEQAFEVSDARQVSVLGLRQEWTWQASGAHTLGFGAELRELDAEFDYRNTSERDLLFTSTEIDPVSPTERLGVELEGSHGGVWISDRFAIGRRWFFELGLRADRHRLVELEDLASATTGEERSAYDDELLSPRFSVAWGIDERSVLRASWGVYHQSQRPYELQVENGESRLARAERAEHAVLGYERVFARATGARIAALRAELYSRVVARPRPRFENLFEPFNVFREVEGDRVLLRPERSRAHGLELSARGGTGRRGAWLASYSLARSEDRIGAPLRRWVPREVDQTHTLAVGWSLRPAPRWTLHLAGRYHSGWPTTPVRGIVGADAGGSGPSEIGRSRGGAAIGRAEAGGEGEDPGEPTLVALGPLRSDRLPEYLRLDLRLARRFEVRVGELFVFLDVQNLLDRRNVSGSDYAIEDGMLERGDETWPGILPSLGVSWTF
ncbi:MAG: TonB-dependent receptor [Acidobacteria bacterium]|mgnify:CR=1 FL=1|nr:MAG: TonB-dependent receptor [Acidobacteriota bacterium]REK04526.1 MAG: TonB-dependent receptor [Acidobacteriota bacterium]